MCSLEFSTDCSNYSVPLLHLQHFVFNNIVRMVYTPEKYIETFDGGINFLSHQILLRKRLEMIVRCLSFEAITKCFCFKMLTAFRRSSKLIKIKIKEKLFSSCGSGKMTSLTLFFIIIILSNELHTLFWLLP